ncbi:retrovirus-related pol polyprotein from transposon TNT 1-94 [Tanacetum coccineum]
MPGETIHSYYMRFAQLINDMHVIGMTMRQLQVNTKFVNHFQPEWGKFVTNVKLAKDMHTTNFDHLYAHLWQHEAHANEFRLARQRYPDQIALVANSPACLNPNQCYPHLSSASQQYYSSLAPQRSYDAPIFQQSQYLPQVVTHSLTIHQQQFQALVLQQSYQAPTNQQQSQPSFPELDSGLAVPTFNPSDDPIASLNKAMAFLSTTFASRRQTQGYSNNEARNIATNPGVNRQGVPVQARVVKCYNCQEEGHFARQCTKPKRPKNSAWFQEKMLLSEALESGAYVDLE